MNRYTHCSFIPSTLSVMQPNPSSRNCQCCGNTLRGRLDKKFCNDYCRNQYNNEKKSGTQPPPYVRLVNNVLLNNRRILARIHEENGESARATRDKLQLMGFHFGYQTQVSRTRNGRALHYCYDYGYLPLQNDRFLIVKRKDEY